MFARPSHVLFAILALVTACAIAFAADEKKGIPIADIQREGVDFQKDILPIFKRSCTACHNSTDAKGGLVLEAPKTIAAGGDSGVAVVPGKADESYLLQLASHQSKPTMPPKNNKANAKDLTSEELGLIKLWINQGAKGDVVVKETPLDWQPLPPGLNPVYAISMTDDGQYVAAGRANQIFIYHVPTKTLVTRLTDPALIKSGLFKQPGNAHRDLVQALAFSPDNTLLASAGYRIVKLWRRPMNVKVGDIALGEQVKTMALSSDGKWLAALGANNTVKLVDLATGKPGPVLKGHAGAIKDVKFSSDNTKLLTGSADKTARIWNAADGKQLAQLDAASEVNAVTWIAKDARFATGHEDKTILIWDTAKVMAPKPEPKPQPKPEPAKEEKKDGQQGDKDDKKDEKKDEKPAEPEPLKPEKEIKIHSGPVNALITLPTNDTQILSGSQDGTMRHINADNGQQIRQFSHGAPVVAVAARPDGQRFASAGGASAKLFRADNGQQVAELKGQPSIDLQIDGANRFAQLQDQHISYYKNLVGETDKRKKAEEDAKKKAQEAVKKAEEDLKAKTDAFAKAEEAKKKADDEFAKAEADLKAATDARATSDTALAKAKDAAKAAQDKFNDLNKAFAKAEQEKNQAQQEKNKAEQENTNQQTKLKQAQDALTKAKEALAAKQDDENLKKSVADAEKKLADAQSDATKSTDALAAATKVFEAADKVRNDAEKLKTDADQANKAAAEALTAAETNKRDADKKFADATNGRNKAEQQAKAQEKPFTDAMNAMQASQRAKESAMNAVAAAGAALQRAEEALAKAKDDQAASEKAKTEAAAAVEAKKKEAADLVRPILAVAFSPDNRLIATGGEGGLVHTWSADDGSFYETQKGHAGPVLSLAFTAADHVISGSADQHAITWDLDAEWKLERTIGTGDIDSPLVDRVLSLAFSPDGKTLATGGGQPSRSGEVKLWNVESGSLILDITDAHSDTVFGMQFSFDGTKLATCAADKFVKTWSVPDGKFIASYEGHTHHVLGVSWEADGRTLMSAGADGVVKIWDVVVGGQKRTVPGFNKEVTAIKFIGVSDTVVTACGDSSIKMIKENGQILRGFGGTTDFMHCIAVTPDGKFVAAGGQTSIVHVWDGAKGQEIVKFGPPKEEKAEKK